jgi:hypothetical protein
MDQLFNKQEKINKQVNKYTSFADHKRYTNDMKTVQKKNIINTSMEVLNNFSSQIENQMLINISF